MTRTVMVAALIAASAACGDDGATGRPDAIADAAGAIDASLDGQASSPDLAVTAPDVPSGDAAVLDGPLDARAGDVLQAPTVDAAPADGPSAGPMDAGADAAGPPDAPPADASPPKLVTMQFTGKVLTVANKPLGLDSTVREAPVSGTFAYDLQTGDSRPSDPERGVYDHFKTSVFTFVVAGHTVEGSGRAIVQIENLTSDTFRFIDGTQLDRLPRIMKLDGADSPSLELFIAITDGSGAMLASDRLPDPFPTLPIATTPHTFKVADSGGTLLMQLDSLTRR